MVDTVLLMQGKEDIVGTNLIKPSGRHYVRSETIHGLRDCCNGQGRIQKPVNGNH